MQEAQTQSKTPADSKRAIPEENDISSSDFYQIYEYLLGNLCAGGTFLKLLPGGLAKYDRRFGKYVNKYLYLQKRFGMRTANYTELRKNLREHIDAVIADNDALIVDRGNNSGVVMISLEEYNAIMETEFIMSNQAVLNDIQKSLAEIADGKGVEVDIETL